MRGRLSVVVLLFLLFAALCGAQTGTSRITGTVSDQTGALIAGARVTATNQATNVSFNTQTSSAGVYSFESVQPGTYRIEVRMQGFKTFISAENALSIGQPMTVNVRMEVGAAAENVRVEAVAENVQTSSSGNFGNVVSPQAITELPIVNSRGRNPLDLINFQPGVVLGSNAGGGVHVHGARDRAWDYTLDGIDVNETSSGGANYTPLKVNPDMLAEFRVVTGNASPEMGRSSGGQVQMVTKSGSNQFHGDASFLYQTPGLNANSVANKSVGLDRPMFVQKIGSFSLGGPIRKDKTFFYANVSLLRTILTSKVTSMVYTQQARQGMFRYVIDPDLAHCGTSGYPDCLQNMPYGSNGTVDGSGTVLPGFNIGNYNIAAMDPAGVGLNQQILNYLDLTPLPNDFTVGDGLNLAGYSWNSPENHNENNYTFKIDHNFSDRNLVFVRYGWGHQNTMGDSANAGQPPFPGVPNWVNTYRLPRNLAINWRSTPNPRMTNEFVAGMNRFGFNFANGASDFQENPPFWLNDITQPLYNDAGNKRTLTTYQANDNLSITKGPHTIRTGFSIYYARHIDNRGSIGPYNADPLMFFEVTSSNPVLGSVFNLPTNINYDYDRPTLQNAINNLLGRVSYVHQGFVSNGTQWQPGGTWFNFDIRMPEYDFYVQDSWKVNRTLTIDAGLRWEIKMAPYNTHDLLLQPDQPMLYNSTPSDTVTWVPGTLWNNQYKNLAPSIGFAWDPFGNGKTSIRANYRIAYDRINTFVISSSIVQNLPGLTYWVEDQSFAGSRLSQCTSITGATVTCGGTTVAPPAGITPEALRTPLPFSTNYTTVMDPNMVTPRTHMWGMSVQRDLGHQMVLELNYLGRHGQNLFGGHDGNVHKIFNNGFLDAFNTVKAGGDSPLIDNLMNGYSGITDGDYANGSAYLRGEYGTSLRRNNIGTIAKFINQLQMDDGSQLIVNNGFSPYFFVNFPQFADEVDTLDTKDISWYHAFEAQLQRRMNNGLQFQMSYTWAKSTDTRSFDPTFTTIMTGGYQSSSSTPFDAAHREYNYAPSDFDRKHALQGEVIYELPFGKGKLVNIENQVLDKIVGGFQIASILVLQSGRPFTAYSGAYTYNDTVMTPASCDSCSPGMGKLQWRGTPFAPGSDLYYFTTDQRSMFYQPAAGALSNLGRNYFRLPHTFNIDMAIAKKIAVKEGQKLELRLEMQNMTNSVQYDLPYSSNFTSSYFGYMTGQQSNGPRTMQLVARFTF